jgi:Putative transposase/Transposase zinc-binding domain
MPTHARHPSGAGPGRTEPGLEVAEIFRRAISAYKQKYGLGPGEARIARDVMACRTAALGGHLDVCAACGFERPAYNSCRNRHCPKCQSLQSARWVARRMDRILPVHYFHVVFTLPSELRELASRSPDQVFDLLLKSAAEALLVLGRDRRWFGRPAQLGITAVLHTWARDLHLHPHVHCIVTGGGLATDGSGWVAAPKDFLFPVHVLGALFRGKFLAGLERLRACGGLSDDSDDRAARRRRARLYHQSWVVYAKRPFGGAEQVYRYLGRYTHRVAISNRRLRRIDDDAIVFETRAGNTVSLPPSEFIRRFFQHRLPPGFVKIRHTGLLAPVNVNGALVRARELLAKGALSEPLPAIDGDTDEREDGDGDNRDVGLVADLSWSDLLLHLTGFDVKVCPCCRQRALVRLPLPDCRGPPPQSLPN